MNFKGWSWSQLSIYETCPLQAKFKYIDRVPEPPRKQAMRGDETHKMLEDFVNGKGKLSSEFEHFRGPLQDAAEWPAKNRLTEVKEMFDSNWQLTQDRNQQWLVIKSDLKLRGDGFSLVVDYKTGKRFGNELKHYQQKQLYGISEVCVNPDVEEVVCEIWYLDLPKDNVWSTTFKPSSLLAAREQINRRVETMMTDKVFRHRANKETCKWCPYSPRGNGHCPVGV